MRHQKVQRIIRANKKEQKKLEKKKKKKNIFAVLTGVICVGVKQQRHD